MREALERLWTIAFCKHGELGDGGWTSFLDVFNVEAVGDKYDDTDTGLRQIRICRRCSTVSTVHLDDSMRRWSDD